MEKTSIERLNKLHELIRQSALDAYDEACKKTPVGVHPFITETIRSFKRSDELYAQGRTKPGQKVTNAKGGDSFHNYGLAFDFVILVDGVMSWKVDKNWMIVGECFKKRGWKWGGDFKSITDYPHFEKTLGKTLAEVKVKYKADNFLRNYNNA